MSFSPKIHNPTTLKFMHANEIAQNVRENKVLGWIQLWEIKQASLDKFTNRHHWWGVIYCPDCQKVHLLLNLLAGLPQWARVLVFMQTISISVCSLIFEAYKLYCDLLKCHSVSTIRYCLKFPLQLLVGFQLYCIGYSRSIHRPPKIWGESGIACKDGNFLP